MGGPGVAPGGLPECQNLLTARFEGILDHLRAAKDTGWSCSPVTVR